MPKMTMDDVLTLHNSISYLDGQMVRSQDPNQPPQKLVEKATLKPATRMFFKHVLATLQPWIKGFNDTLDERMKDIRGDSPIMGPVQQLQANDVEKELRAVEVTIRLPKRKLPWADLDLEANQTPNSVLNGMSAVIKFDDEELEPGDDEKPADAFAGVGRIKPKAKPQPFDGKVDPEALKVA